MQEFVIWENTFSIAGFPYITSLNEKGAIVAGKAFPKAKVVYKIIICNLY